MGSKIFYNGALNPLGALLGVHYGALPEHAESRALMDAVIAEAFAVARADGVTLPWADPATYLEEFYGRLVPATYHHRASMLQDLERGRRTEVDAINGEVSRRGRRYGIATPVNDALTRLVRVAESTRRFSVVEVGEKAKGKRQKTKVEERPWAMADLGDRLLAYGARITRLAASLPNSLVGRHIGGQLPRSGTCVGANDEEARAAESRADFVHKLQITLKDLRESNYWLRLMAVAKIVSSEKLRALLDESEQLKAMLSKAVARTKGTAK